eukprot:TRINITY_DN7296_c0_g1_i2.p1 TRINITY_DN7296_c0_g1~~TRINITY_DN7296_c0_g1_i2.p1  ORF type:complete len:270 (-),score=39.52 TRINITY_DN7296_c0_g1_i2:60-869(-)
MHYTQSTGEGISRMSCKGSCCPEGSWPSMKAPEDYTVQGKVEDIGNGLKAYISGKADAKKAICIINDVFGWHSGRTHGIADHLAAEGYYVVLPDFFRGDPLPSLDVIKTWAPKYPYEGKIDGEMKIVTSFLKSKKFDSVGLIGFCWGSWCIFKVLGDKTIRDIYKCGVCCHPSLVLEKFIFGKDPVALADNVEVPVTLLSASNDPEFVQPDGDVMKKMKAKAFGSKCTASYFADMQHGWVNRGDLNDEKVKRDVTKSLKTAIAFFKEHT